MTAVTHDTNTSLNTALDTDTALPPCHYCDRAPVAWVIRYTDCGHNHLACNRCQRGMEHRQAAADAATPPRPLGRHGCCGQTIFRATSVQL